MNRWKCSCCNIFRTSSTPHVRYRSRLNMCWNTSTYFHGDYKVTVTKHVRHDVSNHWRLCLINILFWLIWKNQISTVWAPCEGNPPKIGRVLSKWTVHDDVIKWNYFPGNWFLWLEFTGYRWIPLTKASDAELWCFLWSEPEQTVETPVIWDAIAPIMTSM